MCVLFDMMFCDLGVVPEFVGLGVWLWFRFMVCNVYFVFGGCGLVCVLVDGRFVWIV